MMSSPNALSGDPFATNLGRRLTLRLAGIQHFSRRLDPGFRRGDRAGNLYTNLLNKVLSSRT